MNQKVLKTLEYDKAINQLIGYATSPLGKALCQNLSPSSGLEEVHTWQAQTTDVVTRTRLKGPVSFSGIRDIGDPLKRLDIGSSLNTPKPLSMSSLLTMAAGTRVYGRYDREDDARGTGEPQDDFDSLEPPSAGLGPLTPLDNGIERCILSEDRAVDDANPELSYIHRSMRVTANRIYTQLNSILNSNRSYLQDAVITMRNGRYYLPVESEYKSQVSGMVHDQSATGSILFTKPMAIIRLNSGMQGLEIQEQREIEMVLASLNNQAVPCTEELHMGMELLAQLDFISVKTGPTRHYKCSAPVFSDEGYIHIKNGYHPLLNPQAAVSIGVWPDRESDLLIAAGPNTGGKAVSLETVSLLIPMGQPGLHIPTWEGSELVISDQVFADIGDEQSIEQNLSTFPAHMTNIVRILNEAGSRSPRLFDGLSAGTGPTEGAALAIAILSFLHNMKCHTAATTHYSELKVSALNTPGVENVCRELNVEILQPTYRLLIGTPGRSSAFAISQRLGLSGYIIDDTGSHLEARDESFEDLLTSLESSRLTIEKEQAEINAYKDETTSLKNRLTQKEECLDKRRDKILENAVEEVQRILREAKETADQTIKQINKLAASSGVGKELEAERARSRDQSEKTDEKLTMKPKGPSQPISPKKLKIGGGVKALSMNLKGTVSTLSNARGDLYVQMGILHPLANIRDLELPDEKDINATLEDGSSVNYGGKAARDKGNGNSQVRMPESSAVSAEVNLTDMTANKAVPAMKKYLDNVYLARLQMVRMVHGRGTEALKNTVHKCHSLYISPSP